jgi:quinol monooxygenase YgiN
VATVLAHIRVLPGREPQFEELARNLYRSSHADERDVRRYEYWRGAEPGTYYTLISFDDFAGFLAHQTSPHHETAGPHLREVMDSIRLEWVDPLSSASPLTPTDMSPLPDDPTELERAYHERFAATVQEWWWPLREKERGVGDGGIQ